MTARPTEHFLVLDRTDPLRPYWRVLRVVASMSATLNEVGLPKGDEFAGAAQWASGLAGARTEARRLPGGSFTYRLWEVQA